MSPVRTALVLILAALAAGPAVGQRAQGDDLSRLQAEHRDEQVRARRLRADAAQAAEEIADLERELASLNAEARDEDGRLADQRRRLDDLSRQEARLVGELSGERARLGRLLSALQMMSRRPPPPLLIPADKAVDTVRAAILMQAITPTVQRRAQALSDRQAEVWRVRRLAALSSEQLFTAESEQMDRRSQIETLSTRRRNARAVMRAEAERAERAAASLEARIRELGGEARALSPGEAVVTSSALPGGRMRLSPPVQGTPVRADDGLTWRGEASAGVRAPAGGVVDYAGPLEGWGQVVILRLGPGWRIVMAGLAETSVETGAKVAEGAAIGRLPDQPGSDLYLEVRRDDRAVDPSRWFD